MRKSLYSMLFWALGTVAVEYQSQCGQDQFVNEHFFHNKRNGIFVDIGAHDGKTGSNTYFFEKELGWSGICVEPLPHLFEQLQACRSCVCVNACIADKQEIAPFLHVVGCDEMLSGLCNTFNQRMLAAVMQDIKNFGGELRILSMPCVTLMPLLKEKEIQHIDFLSIDTEGNELEILKSIDFDAITIDVITVENNDNRPEIREFLIAKGFILVARLQVDDVFVRLDLVINN